MVILGNIYRLGDHNSVIHNRIFYIIRWLANIFLAFHCGLGKFWVGPYYTINHLYKRLNFRGKTTEFDFA